MKSMYTFLFVNFNSDLKLHTSFDKIVHFMKMLGVFMNLTKVSANSMFSKLIKQSIYVVSCYLSLELNQIKFHIKQLKIFYLLFENFKIIIIYLNCLYIKLNLSTFNFIQNDNI